MISFLKRIAGKSAFAKALYWNILFLIKAVRHDLFSPRRLMLFLKVLPFTMVSYERLKNAYELAEDIEKRKVAVILGSRKDEPAVVNSGLLRLLDNAGVEYEYSIISSDRNPDALRDYCQNLGDGVKLIVAVAGLIPNLPIVAKSWTPQIPVISVPLIGEGYEPKDTLLASASTPGERPIIVSGIGKNGLEKAGNLILEMLGISDENIRKKYLALQKVKEAEIRTTPK